MDEEIFGLNLILISIVGCVFFCLYYAVPLYNRPAVNHPAEIVQHDQADKEDSHQPESSAEDTQELIKDDISEEPEKVAGDSSLPADSEAKSSSDAAVLVMNNSAYKKHKKGLVHFTHEKHYTDYGINCGSCHHDENGTALDLNIGDGVEGCIECHSETEKPKGEKLDKEQKIAKYHFEAMHANCIGCHKSHNIENGDPKGKGPAPTSCGACHPKAGK